MIIIFLKKYKIISLCTIFFIVLFFSIKNISNYSNTVFSEISNEVLRLHVIANSNEQQDQEVKLKVRDEVLKYIRLNCCESQNKDEAILFINNNLDSIKEIANRVLIQNGFEYDARVEVGKYNFPTKNYDSISLPQGEYDAVRITLGKAQGENWWCVMFPPLCFINNEPNLEDESLLEKNLSEEAYNIISDDSNEIKIKFKTIEIIEAIKQKLR